jgi:hypothetical protein
LDRGECGPGELRVANPMGGQQRDDMGLHQPGGGAVLVASLAIAVLLGGSCCSSEASSWRRNKMPMVMTDELELQRNGHNWPTVGPVSASIGDGA